MHAAQHPLQRCPGAGLEEPLAALVVSDACNVELTPMADEAYPPLTRDQLSWTAHNYLRSATYAVASPHLFDYHAGLKLAREAWGGGEIASADGMRLVVPISTVHAGYSPRYLGFQRGSTLYTADGRHPLHLPPDADPGRPPREPLCPRRAAGQPGCRPPRHRLDTAGASEIVFALAWTLGYRYAPRLADLADHRLWRIDPGADYGPLQRLARNRANTGRIAAQWDQIILRRLSAASNRR